ncbi:DUF5723 family protein [Sanyastnella coralliicola]|uniref:DUF5723 family protein n=1 Tax=Sanyastnella coralliicola TaxID=3069118 RepID=UPI0027B954CA|nr:DUF5723 family protein [Longitalea sp. SCSIO 12813]
MKKLLLVFGFLLCLTQVQAQRSILMQKDSLVRASSVMMNIDASAEYRSNAFDNELLDKLVFGGYISDELSQRQFDRISDLGTFGAQATGRFSFALMQDSVFGLADWGWQGQVEMRNHFELAMDGDLFHLVFDGNAAYAGESAELSNFWLDYMAYQKLGFGLVHKPSLSGFVISAVNGERFERTTMLDGALFTAEDGDSLNLAYHGAWMRSDTSVIGFGSGNGLGVSLDGQLNIPLQEDRGYVSLGLRDIGFVSWNEASLDYRADSSWAYTGIPLTDIIDDDEDGIPNFEDSLYYDQTTGSMLRWLPGFAYARLMHRIQERDYFEIEMRFRPVRAFNPLIRGGYFFMLNDNTTLGATVTYGGYGNVRAGIAVEQWVNDRFFVAFSAEDIVGPFRREGLGAHAALRLSYLLKPHAE